MAGSIGRVLPSMQTLRGSGHLSMAKLAKVKSHIIDNECSMARDQFAAERNFLSWVKLALTVAASATVIFREFRLQSEFTRLANISTLYFIVLALVLLVGSTMYVWGIQSSLATEQRPLRLFRPLLLQVCGCIGAVSLIFVLAVLYTRLE
ncbi:hypothetical protein GGH19_003239 [Coemansia sp. RSA 1807]|nr:hypothetical protein LPJ62_001213 [Coemansia sp. RSA 2167]KAJ2153990.1 hypothetical protein J3F82_001556 [Coemansia sp. RSA 637]KAJ2266952.1 hypothetical protein EV176_005419 [Coemansia sp. RSA 451]KAJ2531234.1 hypothetical protein GGH20_001573 [Coemansia sp. RSA 1937]KAJ2536366.1 hypothetical protein IWW43_000912 [Coemansia sp. RSA 1935]KAJ2575142.1 hypothetical protein GGH19_003239 [Coemansia sp. RSA 1807]